MKNGCGPRQLIIDEKIKEFAFALCEIDSTITTLKYDKGLGRMRVLSTISTLRNGESNIKMAAAEIKILNQKIYVSNRDLTNPNQNRNSIAGKIYFNLKIVFRIDENNGRLFLMQHVNTNGIHPRFFTFKDDKYLMITNQNSNNIATFEISKETGLINERSLIIHSDNIKKPSHILFLNK
jgi:6-phosphogluconolactonase